jgi:hydroxymethylpyrimidine/phosphomethylpyrimidine kinase
MAPRFDSPPRVLAIAGSDSGGGAGIQADVKALAACGVHGMTAITAITAQNTVGVSSVHPVPAETILDQVRAIVDDIGVDAVKIGMLGTSETIEAVEAGLDLVGSVPVVLDPVMVAESGAVLLDDAARSALRLRLVPRAAVITPNLSEAGVLAGDESPDVGGRDHAARGAPGPDARGPDEARSDVPGPPPDRAERLARAVHLLGAGAVVVTGGHRDEASDLFFDGSELVSIPGERHPDGAAHGSGCTHSSALAAHLALGMSPLEAARAARRVAGEAVRSGLHGIGAGAGPVDALGITRHAEASASGHAASGSPAGPDESGALT